ncbi:MAG: cation transporter [Magnetococcales bacterium]|nr:cation transporter [Magnetococcales bacterium]
MTDIRQTKSSESRYSASQRVTWLSVGFNLFLAGLKIAAGLIGRSSVMVADGIHSLSDLVSDGVVLLALRWAKEPPDREHPSGHGKFETLATLFLALGLSMVALGIAYDAITEMLKDTPPVIPSQIALWGAVLSIAIKEWLYHVTVRVGRHHDSPALIANAWHHRSDAISSIAALIGIAAAMMGFPLMDPMMAIFVALFIGKMGWTFLQTSLQELVEHDLTKPTLERMEQTLLSVPGVISVHQLKGRRLGPDRAVECHIVVNPFLTVSEGHQIARKAEQALKESAPNLRHILTHVDIEDEQSEFDSSPVFHDQLEQQINALLAEVEAFQAVQNITTHQTASGMFLEITLVEGSNGSIKKLHEQAARFRQKLKGAIPVSDAVIHLLLSGDRPKKTGMTESLR